MAPFAFDPPDLREQIVSRTGCTPDDANVLACLLSELDMGDSLNEVLGHIGDGSALSHGRDHGVPANWPVGANTPIFIGRLFDETETFSRYGITPPRRLSSVIDRIHKAIADNPSGAPKKKRGRKPPKKQDLSRDLSIWNARKEGACYEAIAERFDMTKRDARLAYDRHSKRRYRKHG